MIKRFQKLLEKEDIDAAVLLNGDININYFSQNPYISSSSLIIPNNRNPYFVSRNLQFENLDNKFGIKTIEIKKLTEYINKNFKTIGVNKYNFNALLFEKFKRDLKVKIKDISEILRKLRSVKTEEEIEYIKKSCKILSYSFKEVIENFNFKTERDVEIALTKISKEKGGDFCFKAIVASGANASNPHYFSNSSKLKRGFCIIDFGVKYKGYCSDMTRTIFIGKPKKKEIEIYNKVLQAQEAAAKLAKDGIKAELLHKKANEVFGEYAKYFIHNLGHGIGLEIHELPTLSLESKDILKNNMCFTIEPGLYFPNKFGIRIEDSFLLKNKVIPLTKYKKELKIL